MTRERAPRPGVTWQQVPVVVEVVVPDDGDAAGPVGLNREQRRAAKRAGRRKGNQR